MDDLGDRMKAYETVEAKRKLDTDLPIIARIDGRSFSKFTRPFDKPFDDRLTAAMDHATKALVDQTHANLGYTQSDEITLAWIVNKEENAAAQMFFDGRIQKLCSVLAGIATANFIRGLDTALAEADEARGSNGDMLSVDLFDCTPHFDCRVWNVPSRVEASNTLYWRYLDARKNAVSTFTRQYVSHKKMQGLNAAQQLEAAKANGAPDYEKAVTASERDGRIFARRKINRRLTDAEWTAIPEAHRPPRNELVMRTVVSGYKDVAGVITHFGVHG